MMRKWAAVAAAAVATLSTVPVAQAAPTDEYRIGGADRYSVAANLSYELWPEDPNDPTAQVSPDVFVASGKTFADGLAAGAAAGPTVAPLLLVPQSGPLPVSVVNELRRLQPTRIHLAGGTATVGADVEAQLKRLVASGGSVVRYAGANRYAVAAKLAQQYTAKGRVVFLASGELFSDALPASAAANSADMPLLLTTKGTLPKETVAELKRLAPAHVEVVGGAGTVSDAVLSAVKASVPAAQVVRTAGKDRYAGAAALSARMQDTSDVVFLANGEIFSDALAGGAGAGSEMAPLLLMRKTCMPKATADEINRLGARFSVILGGEGTIAAGATSRIC